MMKIRLAETVFDLHIEDKKFLKKCLDRYGGFLSEDAADIHINVLLNEFDSLPGEPEVKVNKILSIKRSDFSFYIRNKKGVLNIRPSVYSLDSFLRVFTSCIFMEKQIILLHACAAFKNGKCFLFPGISGTGKSTISRILQKSNFDILSDELVFVKIINNNVEVFSSPFWGEMKGKGKYLKAKLSKIYFLKKSPLFKREPCSKSQSVSLLLKTVMNFVEQKKRKASLLDLIAKLCFSSKSEFLFFNKRDNSFAKLL